MNPPRVRVGIFGETREQTQLLWIKIWEQPAVAVGRMSSSRLAGRASCFGTRASTILGASKSEKDGKFSPDIKLLLWKTPQPGHQTLLETLLTLTNAHVAEEIDRRFF